MKISEVIAPAFWKTFNSKKPRQIDKGGRGSTKTSKNALKVDLHCLTEDKCSAIVIRKYQIGTLHSSFHLHLTSWQIRRIMAISASAFANIFCSQNFAGASFLAERMNVRFFHVQPSL